MDTEQRRSMKIKYLDFCYLINGNVHQDRKEVVQPDFIPVDDFSALEMYQIMRLPVIRLPDDHQHSKRNKSVITLEILVCSCLQGSIFVYLFKGQKWNTYYVKF